MVRPPARSLHAVLHRDVGALQLLRDARHSRAVHDQCRCNRRHGAGRRDRDGDLRSVYRVRVCRRAAGRMDCGPYSRPAPFGVLGRRRDCRRSFHARHSLRRHLLRGPRPDRHRYRPAEAECQRDGRRSLSRGRCAARRGVFDLLHGDQHRRFSRSAGMWISRRSGQLASGIRSRRRRDGVRTDSVPRLGARHLGTAGQPRPEATTPRREPRAVRGLVRTLEAGRRRSADPGRPSSGGCHPLHASRLRRLDRRVHRVAGRGLSSLRRCCSAV